MAMLGRVWMILGMAAAVCPAATDFDRDIRPIFASRCLACHSGAKPQSEFRLDSRQAALRGGGSGVPAVVPGSRERSLLYRLVAGLTKDTVMPPGGARLPEAQVALIGAWIDEGAPWPETVEAAGPADPKFEKARTHWSFQPRRPVEPPTVRTPDLQVRARNPIDRFVFAKLEQRGWRPAPEAKPTELLRRLYFDVTGLPPALEEQQAFLRDPSPAAFDRLAADLLARPAYGERWARHWLDLARYAESNGYERDAAKPLVWQYRDYVIRAFNDDKPFDRFIVEQLAGDELANVSTETLIATTFLRLGPWDDEPADPATDRYDQLDDLVRTTSEVFLGLTLGCARCHNHKFEPLTANDYYSMVAVFNPLERPRKGRTELLRPIGDREELARYEARDRKIAHIEAGITALREDFARKFLQAGRSALAPDAVQAFLTPPARRDQVQQSRVAEFRKVLDKEVQGAMPGSLQAALQDLEGQIARLRDQLPDRDQAYILYEPSEPPPPSFLLVRGKATAPGPEVQPAVPAIFTRPEASFPQSASGTSQRRLHLARWIANPANPLTARVIVNRVWQFHFGEGLVRTPSDFGLMGEAPTHPELLDWLANWFVENGWSLKKLHRLILSSAVYRMSKQRDPAYAAADPENHLLHHFPYRRLEVEAIRDAMLAVSGSLNSKMFGPSVYPYIEPAALEGSSDPDKIWPKFNEEEASRRTVYAFVKRSLVIPALEVLDFCDTTKSTARRLTTSVPTQALTLLNSEFVNRQALRFARRLRQEAGDDPAAQIERAYRLALARPPSDREAESLLAFLRREREAVPADQDPARAQEKALAQLCRTIFNLNEFVYTD